MVLDTLRAVEPWHGGEVLQQDAACGPERRRETAMGERVGYLWLGCGWEKRERGSGWK